MNNVVRELLEDFEQPETITSTVGIELVNAYQKTKKRIDKIIKSEEDSEERRLAQHYRKVEKNKDLLYLNFMAWKILPYQIQNTINEQFKPFHFSGVCLSYSEISPFLDDLFSLLINTTVAVSVVRLPLHYQLIITNGQESIMPKGNLSVKDVNDFNEYVQKNIIWENKND